MIAEYELYFKDDKVSKTKIKKKFVSEVRRIVL